MITASAENRTGSLQTIQSKLPAHAGWISALCVRAVSIGNQRLRAPSLPGWHSEQR